MGVLGLAGLTAAVSTPCTSLNMGSAPTSVGQQAGDVMMYGVVSTVCCERAGSCHGVGAGGLPSLGGKWGPCSPSTGTSCLEPLPVSVSA